MKHFTFVKVWIFIALSILFFQDNAYAYLDPGSGSYLVQILIAAFAGGAYALKLFWGNIKTFFKRMTAGNKKK